MTAPTAMAHGQLSRIKSNTLISRQKIHACEGDGRRGRLKHGERGGVHNGCRYNTFLVLPIVGVVRLGCDVANFFQKLL